MNQELYSFDIFDTLLIRKAVSNWDIFSIMNQEQLMSDLFGKNFKYERILAERKARIIKGKKTTIQDIYNELKTKFKLEPDTIQKLINLELKTEIENSFLDIEINKKIKDLIASKQNVCLITDMFWPKEYIKEILISKDSIYSSIDVFVSCDFGADKKTGKLYKLVKEQTGVEYKNWHHFGDNVKSDYNSPKKLGINAHLVKKDNNYIFESKLDFSNPNISKTFAIIKEKRSGKPKEYSIGASISGLMVYEYVDWLLCESQRRKINHLYFVLRDGYILKKVADIIIKHKELNIKTDYIFGSRIAWRFPELTIEDLKNANVWKTSNWIFRDPCLSYVCFERLSFSREEIASLFGEEFANKKLTKFNEFRDVLNIALANDYFINTLSNKKQIAQENLIEYFKQTINFNESFAFVDTNSTGKTQKDLEHIFSQIKENKEPIRFFYHSFLSSHEYLNIDTQFVFFNEAKEDMRFPEALYRAPHNPCYGYIKENKKIVPKFFESDYCAWYGSFSYEEYLKGILDVCSTLSESEEYNFNEYSDLLIRVVNFELLSKDVYRILSKIPFNPNIYGNEKEDFYPTIHIRDFLHPFSRLIYFPKGSYYCKNGFYILMYKFLYKLVMLKRNKK